MKPFIERQTVCFVHENNEQSVSTTLLSPSSEATFPLCQETFFTISDSVTKNPDFVLSEIQDALSLLLLPYFFASASCISATLCFRCWWQSQGDHTESAGKRDRQKWVCAHNNVCFFVCLRQKYHHPKNNKKNNKQTFF